MIMEMQEAKLVEIVIILKEAFVQKELQVMEIIIEITSPFSSGLFPADSARDRCGILLPRKENANLLPNSENLRSNVGLFPIFFPQCKPGPDYT